LSVEKKATKEKGETEKKKKQENTPNRPVLNPPEKLIDGLPRSQKMRSGGRGVGGGEQRRRGGETSALSKKGGVGREMGKRLYGGQNKLGGRRGKKRKKKTAVRGAQKGRVVQTNGSGLA